ncbi:MAG: endonuclease/exonuclease/phosphatase family protein [Roseiflexaceae bacterium]|nr:endonuclease/exonuclease/phosphatase family protein [Roseiflexaceae bacterium]
MSQFTLITFNCFGVPAPQTGQRLLALAAALDASQATVACLQEVQARPYRALLARACRTFPHSAFEPHVHAPKGGLLTLARQPITATAFTPYRERGQWFSPALADMALAKGVLRTSFACDGQLVVVLNTHLNANYRGDWLTDNAYARVERKQLRQLAELVQAEPADALVLVCGDFNVPRDSALFREFLFDSGLLDPLAGDTQPTYRPLPGIPARYALPIDFALVRAPQGIAITQQSQIIFDQRVRFAQSGAGFLSDHKGLELRIEWGVL